MAQRGHRIGLLTVIMTAVLASPAGAAGTVPLPLIEQGPIGVFGTPAQNSGTEPWSGAVTTVLPDPVHANVALIATANGGIWRTTDLGAATPQWSPESDHASSLSIASVSFDPTVGAGDRVAIAGIGHRSAFFGVGGRLTGLLESTNGGATWAPLGESDLFGVEVSGASIRGKVIAVTSRGSHPGVWVSTNAGASFKRVSGKSKPARPGHPGHPEPPVGPAFDLVGDPRRPGRLYAAIGGAHGGVFRSDDRGRTWRAQGGPKFGTSRNLAKDAVNMRIAVGASSSAPPVWVAVAGPVADAARAAQEDDDSGAPGTSGNVLDGLFRTVGKSAAWKALDVARPTDPVLSVNPGGQAGVHLAVVGDPNDASLVYVGGDHLPESGGGQIVACDSALPRGSQCRRAARQGTSDASAPHADTRSLVFSDTGHLLLGGDGGVYRDDDPAHPAAPDSRWTSLNGKLDAIEAHSCAWDNVLQTAMCGLQDNGTAEQRGPGLLGWNEIGPFDGNDLAIADGVDGSTAYFSAHALDGFTRRVCTSPMLCFTTTPPLTIAGTGTSVHDLPNLPAYNPIAADAFCPARVALFADGVFESTDGAQSFRPVAGLGAGKVKALAYSGKGCADPARRLYVAASTGLFVRSAGASRFSRVAAYSVAGQGAPVALSIDPGDGRSVWVASAKKVTHVRLGASRATDVTGDLGHNGGISSIVFVPGVVGGLVLAGAGNGMWMTDAADLGAWSKVSGRLPNAVVASLEFDPVDDVLLAGTLGRGAWKLDNAKDVDVPPGIVDLKPAHGTKGVPLKVKARWEDPDRVRFDHVTGRIDFGDHTGSHALTLQSNGRFTATHVYAHHGRYRLVVTLKDVPGAITTQTVFATIT